MGIFNQEEDSKRDFYEEIKSDLSPKNGRVHTIFINLNYGNPHEINLKKIYGYINRKTEYISGKMQEEGYEIIDIKFSSDQSMNRSEVLIIYE